MTDPCRILIADDHAMVRAGLRLTLASAPGMDLVGEAEDGVQAVELTREKLPDVAILDVTMPRLNGLEAARSIQAISPRTHILILTAHESRQLVQEVLRVGARGYILKSDAGSELVAAISAVRAGSLYFTSKVASAVLVGLRPGASDADGDSLSPRERQVLRLMAEGRTTKEIAREIDVSVNTAETHRSNVMRKMEFRTLSDLVRYAIKTGLIDP